MGTDRFTVRAVVVLLGAVAILGVCAGAFLAFNERNVPDFIIGVTMTAMGALGGILAKTSPEPIVEHSNTTNVTTE